jgi:organic hydroperoxide reductase OsmC/OhrA
MGAEYMYRVSAWWTSGRSGLAKCESSPNTIHFSDTAELGGLSDRWTPQQLLLCALAGCFTTTFQQIAHRAGFEYADLEVEIEGYARRNRAAGYSFNEILIRPRLTVLLPDQREAGLALLREANSVSMVARTVNAPQTLEPIVETAKPPLQNWADGPAVGAGL